MPLALWIAEAKARGAYRGCFANVKVSCYSYAGPTVGDAAFARRAEGRINELHRVAIDRDIVPHAWRSKLLHDVGEHYERPVNELVPLVAHAVRHFDYEHVLPNAPEVVSPPRGEQLGAFGEMIYQHLEAYLAAADLSLAELGLADAVPPLSRQG